MKKDGMHIYKDGTKRWYKNGGLHRLDGPAVERASGSKSWWLNDQVHREDGPAVEYADGVKEWRLNGYWYYSFDEWLEDLDVSDEDKLILTLKWA